MNNNEDFIDTLFRDLEGDFDTALPASGHEKRFLEKLNNQNTKVVYDSKKTLFSLWKKPLAIAASFLLLLTLGYGMFKTNEVNTLAKVPEDVQKAQFYFAALVEDEVNKINELATPETQAMVRDAMVQLKKLENDYKLLEEQIRKNGNTKQLLHAMIINFQTRIGLLQDVLNKIENIKNIQYETTSV